MHHKSFRASARRTVILPAMLAGMLGAGQALAEAELSFMMYSDNNEQEVIQEMIDRFTEANPDITITLNLVGYDIIRDGLESQLQAGTGPDIARVTNLGGLNPYYLDISEYVDAADWEADYGSVLPWYRADADDTGIYGFQTELTVTGPYVNVTAFEDAEVDIPEPGATWDDWAEATKEVMDKNSLYAGMVMDRSGHRVAGPAMSYGAKYFDEDGNLIIDDGFRMMMDKMVQWHEDGLMPPDVWPAVSGSKYANGNEIFNNGEVAMHMSGSWAIGGVNTNVGDKFEWRVVPVPCGPAGCGVMPGGAGIVGFKDTEHPEAVAKFIDFLAQDENALEIYGRNSAIPAHAKLQAEGINYADYGAPDSVSEGLNVFAAGAAQAAEQTPQAYALQGSSRNFVIYNATADYISAVMNGDLTMDEAMKKIEEELASN
ncbi:MAG: extracellular solute-binding protein [Granulosicoccus sp.]|nr:extracellular solute-binding protein [Granulosicoccus sp.]